MRNLTREKRIRLLALTASSGSIDNFEVALGSAGCSPNNQVMCAAAAAGQLEVCEWLLQRGCRSNGALATAAAAGLRDVCEYFLAVTEHGAEAAAWAAAAKGHRVLAEWLVQHAPNSLEGEQEWSAFVAAAAKGYDLESFKDLHGDLRALPAEQRRFLLEEKWGLDGDGFVFEHSPVNCKIELKECRILSAAAGSPHPDWKERVQWLEAQGHAKTSAACARAAVRPDALARLTWLTQRGYPLSGEVATAATRARRLDALSFLIAQGVAMKGAVVCAAKAGDMDALRLLQERGAMDSAEALCFAAMHGHLHVVEWLTREYGMDLVDWRGEGLTFLAAHSGSLELLAWLRERGCPWEDGTLTAAVRAGNVETVEWLVARGCPAPDARVARWARSACDVATLACLYRLGIRWQQAGWPCGDLFATCVVLPHLLPTLLRAGGPALWAKVESAAWRCELTEEERRDALGLVAEHRRWVGQALGWPEDAAGDSEGAQGSGAE